MVPQYPSGTSSSYSGPCLTTTTSCRLPHGNKSPDDCFKWIWALPTVPIPPLTQPLSQIQKLTSKISHICQEICDIKSRRKPQSNLAIQNYTSTGLDKEPTNLNYTLEQGNSNSAKEGSNVSGNWTCRIYVFL